MTLFVRLLPTSSQFCATSFKIHCRPNDKEMHLSNIVSLDVNYVVTVRNILTESQCIILHKGIKRVRIRLKNSEHDAEAITYTGCSGS